jgi:hypothetical protein
LAKKRSLPSDRKGPPPVQLPKDALSRIRLGASFAEYDLTLKGDPSVFVITPAYLAAGDHERQKYFFIGRRGTGKTATSLHLLGQDHHSFQIHPGIFSPSHPRFAEEAFLDPKQKPYRSLVAAFKRVLQEEVLAQWCRCCGASKEAFPRGLRAHVDRARSRDFDERLLNHVDDLLAPLDAGSDAAWLSLINEPKRIGKQMDDCRWARSAVHTLVLDRLDELWDGTDMAVAYLSALMHAVMQLNTQADWARALVFLRENVFERVRSVDPEFSRLETSVVGMDWTREQLVEMVERRFNKPFNTRIALGGPTWDHFFADGPAAVVAILQYCQYRPRDVLIYCELALESAVSHRHEKITSQDVHDAQRRFSVSRLKDLGDEYGENFPQIAAVLARFYGLGQRFTLRGMEDLLAGLLRDAEIKQLCAGWIFRVATPESFTRLLFDIGFVGLNIRSQTVYRSSGPRDTTPPAISQASNIQVHPSYWSALDLQAKLVNELDASRPYQRVGLVADLPEAMTLSEYDDRLLELEMSLEALKSGSAQAAAFEDIVGDVIRLCFARVLTNVEAHSRDLDGRVVRDWVASNRADAGFWQMVRQRYDSTQVVWECKNYDHLKSDNFHQISYYLTKPIGRFGIIVFRGSQAGKYDEHVRRIVNDKDGMVLVLGEQDLRVFIRQARNGKVKEAHIQDRYDRVVREVS